jgi:hypothetical protein
MRVKEQFWTEPVQQQSESPQIAGLIADLYHPTCRLVPKEVLAHLLYVSAVAGLRPAKRPEPEVAIPSAEVRLCRVPPHQLARARVGILSALSVSQKRFGQNGTERVAYVSRANSKPVFDFLTRSYRATKLRSYRSPRSCETVLKFMV